MPAIHLFFLSIPGLRMRDVTLEHTPTLYRWANEGSIAELAPSFPCVTSSVQATFWTGRPPRDHGVIANGFYDRDRSEVAFWVARNQVISREQVWDALPQGVTSAVWHAQNIKDCGADYIITPAPIHESDGTTKLWCYSKPDGLYEAAVEEHGHFPLQHYWGPLSNIESTRWILRAAAWLHAWHAPRFHWAYVPHLDYALQKYGPNSPEAVAALEELDRELAVFETRMRNAAVGDIVFMVAGEYAMTEVSGVAYPNRALREAGLLAVKERDGEEHADLAGSAAFAMVDHQFAHVYVPDESRRAEVARTLRDLPGVARVVVGEERGEVGIDHPRSGEIVAIAEDTHWFAYYWWLDDANAPRYARTVDIHSKPGYDPVELFLDPATKSIPLDATLVKGSHGVPATETYHRTVLICSTGDGPIRDGNLYRDVDVKQITLALLGAT